MLFSALSCHPFESVTFSCYSQVNELSHLNVTLEPELCNIMSMVKSEAAGDGKHDESNVCIFGNERASL